MRGQLQLWIYSRIFQNSPRSIHIILLIALSACWFRLVIKQTWSQLGREILYHHFTGRSVLHINPLARNHITNKVKCYIDVLFAAIDTLVLIKLMARRPSLEVKIPLSLLLNFPSDKQQSQAALSHAAFKMINNDSQLELATTLCLE